MQSNGTVAESHESHQHGLAISQPDKLALSRSSNSMKRDIRCVVAP